MATDEVEEFGPFVRRKILGKALRKLRGSIEIKAAAKYSGLSESTISRMERGKQAIVPRTVRVLCQLYEVGAPEVDMLVRQAEESNSRGLLPLDSDTAPDWSAPFFEMEAEAVAIWTFECSTVPGLLQVPDYIRALAAAAEVEGVDQASVELREARQRRLGGANPPRFHAVLDEAVLRRVVGGPAVMAAQIEHLISMADRDHITLQLLAFAAGAHIAMTGAFTMLRYPDELDMNVVFLEHDHAALMAERPTDLARYARMFDRLCVVALSPEETRAFLVNLAAQYWASGRGAG
jgi:transcriptional regulator with XRE-family HTH domain